MTERFVGTFHKSGSVLMYKALRRFMTARRRLMWFRLNDQNEPAKWDVCFDHHSHFLQSRLYKTPEYKAVIIIRDPRDVIVSGAKYHQWSEESWLHIPDKKLGGRTYLETIKSLPSMEDKLTFEMEHIGKKTIDGMVAAVKLAATDERIMIVRLEDLMVDFNLTHFRKMATFLEFEPEDAEAFVDACYRESIFHPEFVGSEHIQSGQTKNYESAFTPTVNQAFNLRFPSAISTLGYI